MRHQPFALRCRWLSHALTRNPLARASDRIEALAVLMVFVMAVLAIPFASAAGDDAYDARMRLIDEQTRTRHSVEAVALTGTTPTPGRYTRPGPVRAQWREGTQDRSETVHSPTPVQQGETVTVWLDSSGRVVPAPDTPKVAKAVAAGRSWTVWLGTVGATVLLACASRYGLDRLRARSWERELQVLAHNDDGWADRHS